jgi:RNA polymerase sigma-70 factor (ECF subfamily)
MEQNIELLYRLYAKELYSFIFSVCKDKELSEDIVQTTFVEAIKSIEQFKGKSSVKTWLYSIAKHQCYQQLKKKKIDVSIEDIELKSSENVSEAVIFNICSEEVMLGINELDEPSRSIVLLRVMGEYSFAEIGKLVGKSENYCRVNFYRIKNKLRKEFAHYE